MTTLKIPVTADIVALRLHAVAAGSAAPAAERATWLLSLRDQQKQRRADAAALHALVASITDALEATPAMVGERLDGIASIAVELGLGVAREIVGNALERGHVDPSATVARCLRECLHGNSGTEMSVHLHPQDMEIVQQSLANVPDLREQMDGVRFAADPRAGRGTVRVETEAGKLKYDPRDVLDRISEAVRREVRREVPA